MNIDYTGLWESLSDTVNRSDVLFEFKYKCRWRRVVLFDGFMVVALIKHTDRKISKGYVFPDGECWLLKQYLNPIDVQTYLMNCLINGSMRIVRKD